MAAASSPDTAADSEIYYDLCVRDYHAAFNLLISDSGVRLAGNRIDWTVKGYDSA